MNRIALAIAAIISTAALTTPIQAEGKSASQSWVQGKISALKKKDKALAARIRDMGSTLRGQVASPRAYPRLVEAVSTGVEDECSPLAKWAGGDVALCVGASEHVGDPDDPSDSYGYHTFLWLESIVPIQRITGTYETVNPGLGCDEVVGNCLGDPAFARFLLVFTNGGDVSGGADASFLLEDGTILRIIAPVVLCQPECVASAIVTP